MSKRVIIVIIVFAIYLAIIGSIFGFNIVINNQNFLIVNNSVIFEFKNNKWKYVDNFKRVDGKKYNTYLDYENIGYAQLQYYNSEIYIYKDNQPLNYDFHVLAYSGKRNVIPIEYSTSMLNSNDYSIIGNYFEISYSENIKGYKVIYDLDNDGINETLYCVDYIDDNKTISAILIYDDKIIDVEKYIYTTDEIDVYTASLYDIIDIKKDGNLEIIIRSSMHDNVDINYRMYQYKNGIEKISEES